MTGDDELFEELQRLVSPAYREPPAESIAALQAAVVRQFSTGRKRPWWRHRITIGAAVFGLIAGTPSAAFGLGAASLPDPLRTAMHAIGLPVDSVPVADTKEAESDLQKALRDRVETDVTRAATHLQNCLADLDPSDRANLEPKARSLLQAAAGMTVGDDGHPEASSEQAPNGASGTDGDHQSVSGTDSGSNGSTQVSGDGSTSGGGGGTGDGETTTPTSVSPFQTQTSGSGDTATTVQGGSSDGGSSSSGDGGGGDGSGSTSTTTVDQSH